MNIPLLKTIAVFALLSALVQSPASGRIIADSSAVTHFRKEVFDPETATQEYINQLSPEQKEKSDSYFEGGYWITIWQFVLEIILAGIFLFFLSGWISKIAGRFKRLNIRNMLYALLYLLFAYLVSLPFSIYTDFIREHQYDLSNMTFVQWFEESLISLALMMILGGFLIMIIYIVMRKIGRNWWILGSAIVFVFMVFSLFISPVFISPLFNEYKPLDEGLIKDEILALARSNGVPVNEVYQFNASKQSSRISANVSGFGSTIRISLNDNLLNQCTPAEIKSVMAHELGHYVLNHIYKLLIYFSIVIIFGFAFVNWFLNKAIIRYGKQWGIQGISDIKSLPLFVLAFSFYMLIATPVNNNIIRSTESEADIFGLNAGREPDGFASVSMKLSEYRKISPGKLEEFIFFDHPSGKSRVHMAMQWKASRINKMFPEKDTLLEPFIPDITSLFPNVRDIAFSPDGKEMYFTIVSVQSDLMHIVYLSKKNGLWTQPDIASFSGRFNDLEPYFSLDGLRLFFSSNRPRNNETGNPGDYDIWFVERKSPASAWSKPINLGAPVNTKDNEFYPSVSSANNLYYTTDGSISKGKDDIFTSEWVNGKYANPTALGDSVNTPGYEFNAWIAPDESFIIYTCYERAGGMGSGDLYISNKKENGLWTSPRNLGKEINTKQMEYCPWVDLKSGILYFTSQFSSIGNSGPQKRNLNDVLNAFNSFENGQSRLYKADIKSYIRKSN
jgi:STE24 endopeptidase